MANVLNASSTNNGGLIATGDDSGVLNIQTNETTAISIDASQNLTFTNAANLPNTFGFKNRLINGGMVIDQRNAGASVTATNTAPYTIDRWACYSNPTSKFTVQQNAGSVTPPAGYVNYLGVTSSSSYSIGASERALIFQYIEGLNCADLAWGTASAATVTLSFWVRSSLTGTFGGALQNQSAARSYPFSFVINAANTWEQKSITVVGDTSGTWLTTNGVGISVYFGLGVGSTYSGTAGAWAGAAYNSATGATSVVGTNGATFYITGVQLEKGTQATSFDFRSYGTELALCQRYFNRFFNGIPQNYTVTTGVNLNTTQGNSAGIPYPAMRATPTATLSAGTLSYSGNGGSASSFTLDAYAGVLRIGYAGTSLASWGVGHITNSSATALNIDLAAEL